MASSVSRERGKQLQGSGRGRGGDKMEGWLVQGRIKEEEETLEEGHAHTHTPNIAG